MKWAEEGAFLEQIKNLSAKKKDNKSGNSPEITNKPMKNYQRPTTHKTLQAT